MSEVKFQQWRIDVQDHEWQVEPANEAAREAFQRVERPCFVVPMEDFGRVQKQRDELLAAVKALSPGILDTQTGVFGRDDTAKASVLWDRAQNGSREMRELIQLAKEIVQSEQEGA